MERRKLVGADSISVIAVLLPRASTRAKTLEVGFWCVLFVSVGCMKLSRVCAWGRARCFCRHCAGPARALTLQWHMNAEGVQTGVCVTGGRWQAARGACADKTAQAGWLARGTKDDF
jgi:hypothetical protein